MSAEVNMSATRDFMERAFNNGDLSAVDDYADPNGVDHQEPPGTDFQAHLKQAIQMMRTAFPDLHFEIHEMLADDDYVSFRSTMTGTHQGVLRVNPAVAVPPTGRKVTVPHLHFIRYANGKSVDLWHQWDIPGMMRQMGINPQPQRQPA